MPISHEAVGQVEYLYLVDNAGNGVTWTAAALQARGWPTQVVRLPPLSLNVTLAAAVAAHASDQDDDHQHDGARPM
jgi:hypothetical protein